MFIDSLPGNTAKVIIGDLNARVDREPVYKPTIGRESFYEVFNDNTRIQIINFATSKDLVVSSTYFPRKDIYTKIHMDISGYKD